jgi:hypothetical protein
MNLKELQDKIKIDLKIQSDELVYESVRTPDLHNEYSKIYMSEKMAFKKLEREYDILYLQQWEYYRKKAPESSYVAKPLLKKILDSDIKIYLAADPEMQELRAQIDSKEEIVDLLKRALDQISNRQWIIRNSIEYLKYLGNEKGPA